MTLKLWLEVLTFRRHWRLLRAQAWIRATAERLTPQNVGRFRWCPARRQLRNPSTKALLAAALAAFRRNTIEGTMSQHHDHGHHHDHQARRGPAAQLLSIAHQLRQQAEIIMSQASDTAAQQRATAATLTKVAGEIRDVQGKSDALLAQNADLKAQIEAQKDTLPQEIVDGAAESFRLANELDEAIPDLEAPPVDPDAPA